ncbi:unnamed protein product [Ambrosiozyma monospora]|uniref:Unnamed protein product n=1 Tax=Ambrosiozyma monospora TaxID=43982 RepID=A0ACB5SY18_AMBMO|nr:unnamed protein product [Ambrosiozyma monospora]
MMLFYLLWKDALNFTYWCYTPDNNHDWGDNWNLEDFSLYSRDDPNDATSATDTSKFGSYLKWITNTGTLVSSFSSGSSKKQMIHYQSGNTGYPLVEERELETKLDSILEGTRIEKALIRPYPITTNGIVSYAEFDLNKAKFVLIIDTNLVHHTTTVTHPTTIFLPKLHFPVDGFKVEVTAGSFIHKYNKFLQVLERYHDIQIGNIKITVFNINEGKEDTISRSQNPLKGLTCGYL